MGLFSTNRNAERFEWQELKTTEDLQHAIKRSETGNALFFKHSTRCSISTMALNSFESSWKIENSLCELFFVDLLKYREISNEIERITGIAHQSPQVIVVKNNKVVYNASHSSIEVQKIHTALN